MSRQYHPGTLCSVAASTSIPYRAEIDGLRALAVVSVVLFHLGARWLPGGFIGVDVFFVISGFLITSILIRDLERGHFRLCDFWLRRARRLLPVLVSVLAATMATGFLVLVGDDLRMLGGQTASAMSFWANVWMYRHADNYWGATAEGTPLLHLWSLSVEEQFYLGFPLLLLLVFRKARGKTLPLLVLATVASFVVCLTASRRFPAATFYLLPTRAWELLIGCALALLPTPEQGSNRTQRVQPWIADIGLLLVLASLFLVGRGPLFPAPMGLMPTLGAAMFLWAGRDAGRGCQVLSSPVAAYLGRISYSWYLWHWPLIVIGRQFHFENAIGLFVLSFGFAAISYHLIEKPTRNLPQSRILPRIVFPALAVALVLVLAPHLGLRPVVTHPLPTRWCDADLRPGEKMAGPGCVPSELAGNAGDGLRPRITIPGPIKAVLIGDSHANAWLPAFDAACRSLGWNYAAFPASATVPFLIPTNASPESYFFAPHWSASGRLDFDRAQRAFFARTKPSVVLIAARWFNLGSWTQESFDAAIADLLFVAPGSRLLFLGQPRELPIGQGGFASGRLELGPFTSLEEPAEIQRARIRVHGWIQDAARRNSRIRFVDVLDQYQRAGKVMLMRDGQLQYFDDDHLSLEGAMRSMPLLRQALQEAISD